MAMSYIDAQNERKRPDMTEPSPPVSDPYDVREFRFRDDNRHNSMMLEYQAEKAFLTEDKPLAAAFSQAAGLYLVAALLTENWEG